MRTTINIPDGLISELTYLSDAGTKTAAVNKALEEWIKFKKRQRLLALKGKIDIVDNISELRKLDILEIENEI